MCEHDDEQYHKVILQDNNFNYLVCLQDDILSIIDFLDTELSFEFLALIF